MKSLVMVAAVLLAIGLTGCTTAIVEPSHVSSGTGAPHLLPAACPARQAAPPAPSSMPGADDRLLPFTPTIALLCAYKAGELTRSKSRIRGSALAFLAGAINSNGRKVTDGAISCPAAFTRHVAGYFASRTESIEISFETSGCAVGTNGSRAEYFAFSGSTEKRLGQLIGASFGQ